MTEIKAKGFGLVEPKKDIRDYKLKKKVAYAAELPATYLIDIIPVKNQGSKPTCVAHSLAEIVEFHNMQANKPYTEFSTEYIYGNRSIGSYIGDGMRLRDALNAVRKDGDVEHDLLPGNSDYEEAMKKVNAQKKYLSEKAYPNRISTYYKVEGVNQIKYAILNHGPVIGCMDWPDVAYMDKDGVIDWDIDSNTNGHAVIFIGWDEENFIFQNSWGPIWGRGGIFKIPFYRYDELFYEVYGITDTITDDIQKPNIFVKIISPIINFLLNLIGNNCK